MAGAGGHVRVVADVVIARHGAHRQREMPVQLGGIDQVLLVARAVERDVAGIDQHVEPGPQHGLAHQLEILHEIGLGGAEMGVGNLGDPEHGGHSSQCW